jgi:hypothetical protein
MPVWRNGVEKIKTLMLQKTSRSRKLIRRASGEKRAGDGPAGTPKSKYICTGAHYRPAFTPYSIFLQMQIIFHAKQVAYQMINLRGSCFFRLILLQKELKAAGRDSRCWYKYCNIKLKGVIRTGNTMGALAEGQ